jgi:NADH-quinone oxidoreductase subunit E
MPRLTPDNELVAREIISRYPRPKSALIPLLHLVQEQDGYVTDEGIRHVAELVGCTPAEVLGTGSFYEMFKLEPVGTYLLNICTDISCMLLGADDLLHHAERELEVASGQTTADGTLTLQEVTCVAACTEAPCAQVNYRYENRLSQESLDDLIAELRQGTRADIPRHGTLGRVRQHIPDDRRAGVADPEVSLEPVWMQQASDEAAPS